MRKRLGFREWEHLSDCTGLFVPVEVEVPVKTRLKSEWESGRVGPQAADDAEASALSAGTRALYSLKAKECAKRAESSLYIKAPKQTMF